LTRFEIRETNMAKKKDDIPRLYVRKGATLKEIYAAYRKHFTAADLQKYTVDEHTVDEPMVPMKQVIAQMEAIHKEETQRRRKKK
jgi:hypothetical protein